MATKRQKVNRKFTVLIPDVLYKVTVNEVRYIRSDTDSQWRIPTGWSIHLNAGRIVLEYVRDEKPISLYIQPDCQITTLEEFIDIIKPCMLSVTDTFYCGRQPARLRQKDTLHTLKRAGDKFEIYNYIIPRGYLRLTLYGVASDIDNAMLLAAEANIESENNLNAYLKSITIKPSSVFKIKRI